MDVEAERQRWTIKRLRLKEAGQRRAVSGRRAWMGAREWQLGVGPGRVGVEPAPGVECVVAGPIVDWRR